MVGDKKILRDGRKYNRFFEPSDQRDTEIEKADVMTTLEYMQQLVTVTLWQTEKIARVLLKSNEYETSKAIWEFLHHHIQYKLDKRGWEELRTPNRSWADRLTGIDCDCFSIFASSILTNLGIDHSLKITKYDGKDYFQHVYVVVHYQGREIIIDPVVKRFNYEVPETDQHYRKMSKIRHRVLSGVSTVGAPTFGNEFNHILSGLGSVNQNSVIDATKAHLLNTLRIVEKNPGLIKEIVNPQTYINQLQFVLQNWENPVNRLRAIEKVESQSIQEDLSGLGRRRRRLKAWVGKQWSSVKKTVSDTAKKVGDTAKKVVKAVVSYNPLSLAMKGGLLAAFKVNLFKMTERLKWGYLTEAQVRAKNLDINTYRAIRGVLSKVEGMYEKLGGKKETLKNAILNGRNGSLNLSTIATSSPIVSAPKQTVFVNEVKSNNPAQMQESPFMLNGLGADPVVTPTVTAAASGLIATITAWLKKVDVSKLIPVAIEKGKDLLDKRNQNPYSTPPITTNTNSGSRATTTTTTATNNNGGNGSGKKDNGKNNNGLLIGVGIAAAAAVIYGMSQSKKKSSGMGSVPTVAV